MNHTPFNSSIIKKQQHHRLQYYYNNKKDINSQSSINNNICYLLLWVMPSYHFIVCTDEKGHIGNGQDLLYSIPIDMQRFKSITSPSKPNTNVVLMGFNTWSSIPEKNRPLENRVNIVLTRNDEHSRQIRKQGGYPFIHLHDALVFVDTLDISKVYIIGGASLYNNTELTEKVNYVHHTQINDDASVHYPEPLIQINIHKWKPFHIVEEWSANVLCCYADNKKDTQRTMNVSFRTLQTSTNSIQKQKKSTKKNAEQQYLQLLNELLTAPRRETRNSVTLSSFGKRMVIDLSDGHVPLLTSKKMAWKTIIKELLWFVRGDTDNTKLQEQNVHIWDANGSREFLDSRGLTEREENDLGPVYGFQWRHFGASYVDCHLSYKGQGVDQLEECRKDIETQSQSRRMIFSAWNPSDLSKMALPPCHLLGQWYVTETDQLWLQIYQRSGDMFLGVPFNLFSYSVLVHMMAHLTHKKVGGLIHILGDAHIYETHIDVVRDQLQRPTHPLPSFRVKEDCKVRKWEDFTLKSFDLIDYVCEGSLKAQMVA